MTQVLDGPFAALKAMLPLSDGGFHDGPLWRSQSPSLQRLIVMANSHERPISFLASNTALSE